MMNMDVFKKLKLFSSIKKITASIVILQGGIYISRSDGKQELIKQHVTQLEQSTEWQEVLVSACKKIDLSHCHVNVIIGSHLYQSFQIENPNLTKEELSGALPFLVKDFINDRVSEIVADGVEIATGKLQVYVSQIATIKKIIDTLKSLSIQVVNVTPDELMWQHFQAEESCFMLLTHSSATEFKLLAFNGNNLLLNRSLRSITGPLTADKQFFQLDSLALELQRSLDYLSAQLHRIDINNFYFLCDNEDDVVLTSELQKRLDIKVSSVLVDDPKVLLLGEVLGWLGLFNSADINLYNNKLKSKPDFFTIKNVAASWLFVFIFMSAIFGHYQWQEYQVEQRITKLSAQEQQNQKYLANLKKQLENHKPSIAKLAEIAKLQQDIKSKKMLLEVLERFDHNMQTGYSGLRNSLAQLGKNNVSLTKICISGNDINFTGYARSPDAIPRWIRNFENELHLDGRTFDQLDIETNKNGLMSFVLSTKVIERK